MNSFDYDSFLTLLVRYMDSKVTRSEEEYIARTLKESEDARQLMKDVRETFAMDLSILLPAQPTVKKQTSITRIFKTGIRPSINGSMMAVSFAILLTSISLQLLQPSKKPDKNNQYNVEETRESARGPYISLGAEGDIYADSGFTHIVYKPAAPEHKWTHVNVPKGSSFKVKLPDGTKVQLYADSKLRFPVSFSAVNRDLYLEGEAYFEMPTETGSPLVVHTPEGDLASRGKSFNVEAYDRQLAVSVVSGSVMISTVREKKKLSQGQMATADSGRLSVESFNETRITSRLEGRYIFNKKTVSEICRQAERIYNVSILLDQEEVRNKRFSGAMNTKEPVYMLLEDMKMIFGLKLYVDEKGAYHLR